MAKKDFVESRSEELDALTEIEGVDAQKILSQVGMGDPTPETPPGETPPAETPPVGETPPGSTPPGTPASPTPETPPAGGAPPAVTPPVDVDQVRADFLKEIFGDQFKTVDDLKQANVTGQLQELSTLREGKVDLEAKLEAKPKTSFVNDDIALFNEFVKETGNSDFGVFKKVNSADIANMDHMEAMVVAALLQTPALAGQEGNLKKSFERKYNLDPENVDEAELAQNKIGLLQDGEKAKQSLLEVKSKLKMPEPPEEAPPAESPKELTAEEKTTLQTKWGPVAAKIGETYGTIPIYMKDSKEPVLSYQIDSETQKVAIQDALNYCTQNRMELNEDNVKHVAGIMQNRLLLREHQNIMHSVFEKARSLTEEQVTALYDNPSPAKNTDTPPATPASGLSPADERAQKAYDAEMKGHL
jgi:hypothetical protein